MNSMTGFGRGTASDENINIVVQLTSVNRRNLEVAVSMPKEWQSLESGISAEVRKHTLRGRIHVAVEIQKEATVTHKLINEEKVDACLDELKAYADKKGIPFSVDAGLLLQIINSQRTSGHSIDLESAGSLILDALKEAVEELVAMRSREGQALAVDLGARVKEIEGFLDQIRTHSEGRVLKYKELLLQRLQQAGLELDLDDERVLKEISLFADRCDISEEMTRLSSHFEQLNGFLEEKGSIGRKMEFLLQEIGREINTIGSKANHLEISRSVIECKNELERIREQVLNVE
ncbi:MAG: YicC family protein [Opitutaceae bacterium]|nr:YicC family protein [Opitutaceae bacterium]